jgi:hypothetical protein
MLVSGISCTVNDRNTRVNIGASFAPSQGGRRFGEAVASRISLEANANKEPAHAFTLHTPIIAVITCGFARWAFGPIFLTDCALIYSRASMRARHAPAFPIGQDNVMAGRSTACTNCDWFRALHAVGQYILPAQPLGRGKGGPIEGRPMIKSEFCQIPPNRLQPVDRIAPTWSIGLSTNGQSAVFDRAPDFP